MSKLLFVEESHQYFLMNDEGVAEAELPALTNILKAVGIIDTRWFKPEHAARGKAVHRALELIDKGELDWGSVDPRMYGYIEAYLKFKEKYFGGSYAAIEEPTYHKQKLYGCTPDRVAGTAVLDFKTGGQEQWHALQLTGCADALKSQGIKIDSLCGVYLQDNGEYKPLVTYDPEYEAWDAVLQTYRWTKEGRDGRS